MTSSQPGVKTMRSKNHRALMSHRPNGLKNYKMCMAESRRRRVSLPSEWARIIPVSSHFPSMMMEDYFKMVMGYSCAETKNHHQLEERWALSTLWKASRRLYSRHWAHLISINLNLSCSVSTCKTLWRSHSWLMKMVTTYCIEQPMIILTVSVSSWSLTTSNA